MNNFDLTTNSVNQLVKWLRTPTIYSFAIFDVLVILMAVHWTYGYLTYIGLFLVVMFFNKCMNNAAEMPTILKQYMGMNGSTDDSTKK
jgi:hypothetical protein